MRYLSCGSILLGAVMTFFLALLVYPFLDSYMRSQPREELPQPVQYYNPPTSPTRDMAQANTESYVSPPLADATLTPHEEYVYLNNSLPGRNLPEVRFENDDFFIYTVDDSPLEGAMRLAGGVMRNKANKPIDVGFYFLDVNGEIVLACRYIWEIEAGHFSYFQVPMVPSEVERVVDVQWRVSPAELVPLLIKEYTVYILPTSNCLTAAD